MKTCSKCLVEKKEEAFQLHSNMKDGILNMCRTCKAAAAYARKAAAAITLSAAARRRIGIDPMPDKRVRAENEATPPGSDLFRRALYVPSLHNPPTHQRPGSDHSQIKSRTPFND